MGVPAGQENSPEGPVSVKKAYHMAERIPGGEPLEIERKFLIRYPDLSLLEQICSRKAEICQTYLVSEQKCSRRIRCREYDGKTEYWYNEKQKLTEMTRIERERQITEKEYLELLQEAIPGSWAIRKTRYDLPCGDLCFEIDVFPEWNDRAFAEVELDDECQGFTVPDCLTIIKEVTADKRYTNKSLAINGFVYEDYSIN